MRRRVVRRNNAACISYFCGVNAHRFLSPYGLFARRYAVPNPAYTSSSGRGGAEGGGPPPPKELLLLQGITAWAESGALTALMGGSGAGKTTLMDCVAGRKTVGEVRGEITVNGHPKEQATWSRVMGYGGWVGARMFVGLWVGDWLWDENTSCVLGSSGHMDHVGARHEALGSPSVGLCLTLSNGLTTMFCLTRPHILQWNRWTSTPHT